MKLTIKLIKPGEDQITRLDLARTPAMERTPRVQAMASAARRIGSAHGHSFGEASTGGTSDAAWAAALGIPTIDGLGPVGGLDHTPRDPSDCGSRAEENLDPPGRRSREQPGDACGRGVD